MYTYSKQIPIIASPDILVVGSGSAGATAAIAAARLAQRGSQRRRVMLIERYGFLGGTSTAVLDTFYGFYTPGSSSTKVVSGVADDVIAGLRRIDRVIERPNTFGAGTGITYNPEFLKVVWERLALEAGVELLMHSFVTDVVLIGDRIESVVVDGKAGLGIIQPGIVVDASGDADVAARAGAPFERAGEINPAQTLTTTFKIANVDVAKTKTLTRALFVERLKAAAESGAMIYLAGKEAFRSLQSMEVDGYHPDRDCPSRILSIPLIQFTSRKSKDDAKDWSMAFMRDLFQVTNTPVLWLSAAGRNPGNTQDIRRLPVDPRRRSKCAQI